jgi:predicted dehydrogenase
MLRPVAPRFRVGLVGGGPWARRVHAPALAAHPEFDLVGVWTRRHDIAAELAAVHDAKPFDDVDALIGAVDVVAVAVPPTVQPDIAIAAARAGRHLVLEKPIAATLDAATAMAEDIGTAGVASVIALVLRYAPETRRSLADLAAGGPWAGGNARWLSGALLGGEFAASPWRQQHGALLDIGPHLFDLLDAGLGEIVEVCAATFSEPDLWHVICEHRNGATSSATFSMRLPIDPSVLEFDAYGDHGRRTLDPRQTSPAESYATMLDELAAMIRSGTTTHACDVRRGVHLQRIIERSRDLVGESRG